MLPADERTTPLLGQDEPLVCPECGIGSVPAPYEQLSAELTQAITSLAAQKEIAEDRYELLYNIGCRESCMGWVNERAELAESKLSEAQQTIEKLRESTR